MQILDIIFPKLCVNCRKIGQYLCKDCAGKIVPIAQSICPMCERPAIDGVTHPVCATRYSLDGLTSFFRYDGPIKAIIKRLKYKPYLDDLVEIVLNRLQENSTLSKMPSFNKFVVVPVPLHPQRERERGFNQASLLGKAIATQVSLEFRDNVLKRTRYTTPQVNLKGDGRRKNLANAFALDTKYNIPNTILLVDDVWTTGSTMRICGNVLKRGEAQRVWGLTIAR